MANKALLVGVSEYKHGLEQLPSTVNNIDIVRRVLLSSEAGRFAEEDIKVLTNPNLQMMEEEIENLFLYPQSDDLIFFFYSGHCIQDSGGKLYLSSSTTRRSYTGDLIRSSALAAGILHESMNRSSSRRQIVILDSHFRDTHGENSENKNVVNVSVQQSLARGAAAVADSLPKPYLFAPDASELLSYHRYLIEGIEKIIVDKDEDAYFYIDDLHEYVIKKFQENSPSITPKFSPIELGNHKILQAKLPTDVGKSKDEREIYPVKQQLISTEEIGESEPSSKELSPTSLPKKIPAKIKTQSFEFEFATIAYVRSRFLGIGKTCELQKKKGIAEFFTLDLGEGVVKEMIAIPGGQFMIGSPAWELERLENEGPQQIVIVEPFFMGKFTVTQAQWARVACFPKLKIDLDPDPSYFKGLDRPVEKVSWNDVQEFCARLSVHTKMNMRLPTEAEWEYACRAKTSTPFYFGETISMSLANYRGTDWADEDIEYKGSYAGGPKGKYRQQTTNVGIFPANPFGLYDMHGNVWEWCQDDWRENYDITLPGSTADIEISETKRKVLRGGSWHSFPDSCRSASRLRGIPDSNPYHIGLRVVCDGVTE
ncbi:SUMF1/EgtB/PvdO family nonheme iron enzyme [Mastigocoleus testarum]|uniref:SUMF1/EgtB/PvdO family nonheme iron enzyme n=1 Tax=Mastigocoleus testarum TaxID=996925 RepID=UPI000417FC60|nr:SUMF1/EgtB/PvdO family nonheme iron enzyme [Mastigocoleus testarum]